MGFAGERIGFCAVFEAGGVDADVESGTCHGGFGSKCADAGVAHRVGVAFASHGFEQVEGGVCGLHGAQGHFCGIQRGFFHCAGPFGFLGFCCLRHGEYGHYAVEGFCVFIDKGSKGVDKPASLFGIVGKFFPPFVPTGLVCRKICHHSAEGGGEGTHVGRDGASAGGGRFRRCFVGKFAACHVNELAGSFLSGFEHVFNYFFFGYEWLELVKAH